MPKDPVGFVSLKALKGAPADSDAALTEIRRIYFNTTRQTIANDFVHAIELLKTIEDEDERDKARVYMDGLSQMRSDWERKAARTNSRVRKTRPSGPAKTPRAR